MIIQAELKCKQTECEADPCAVDKVIELPSPRFRQFSRALLADYDFIAENKNAIRHNGDARHCLLILDAEGTDGFLIDPQGYNYARYSAFVPNACSLLTPNMAIDRSYLSLAEPWRDESRDEMLRMTLRVNGKPDYTLVLPADEEYLDAVKAYLDIDVFADAMLCDIRFKVPYIGELIRDTDCPAVEDYNDFAEALEDIWQQDGALLTYAAVLEAERPVTLRGACELLRNLDNYQRIVEDAYGYGSSTKQLSVKRSYPNLAEQDTQYIPKSIEDGGRTLTLSDIQWQTDNTANMGGYAVADRYTAVATYTGSATSSYVKGYTVTADYTGTVSRIALNRVRYVAIFEGTPIQPAEPANVPSAASAFRWSYVLIPLGIVAAAGAGVGGALLVKHRKENADEEETAE